MTGRAPAIIDQGARLQTPLSEAAVATEVLVALRDAGLSPRTVSVDRPSLDSVFMALTGRPHEDDDNDDGAAPPAAPSAPSPSSANSRSSDAKEQS